MTAPRRRLIVKVIREQFHVSQRRVSRALDLARSSLRYAPVVRDEQAALAGCDRAGARDYAAFWPAPHFLVQ